MTSGRPNQLIVHPDILKAYENYMDYYYKTLADEESEKPSVVALDRGSWTKSCYICGVNLQNVDHAYIKNKVYTYSTATKRNPHGHTRTYSICFCYFCAK